MRIYKYMINILYMYICIGCGPLTVTVANEGLYGFPIKNAIILVVTVTGRGPHPIYVYIYTCGLFTAIQTYIASTFQKGYKLQGILLPSSRPVNLPPRYRTIQDL